jgi:hypothetical protein
MCSYIDLANLVVFAYMFIRCYLLERKQLSFVVHLEFLNNRHKCMSCLKDLTLVNEAV